MPYHGVDEGLQQDCPNIVFADRAGQEVVEAVAEADVIINIARGEEVVVMSTEQKMELLADTEMTAVIVADIAHMPRVMWLADYLMPDNFKLVFVESRMDLDEETLQESMEREERSLNLTRNWLPNQMGTRNPAKVGELADKAYWGKDSTSNKEINASIQQAK